MELTIQELQQLTNPPLESPGPCSIYTHLIGQRILIRTYTSGVTIGILKDVANTNGQIAARFTNAIRIWRWENAFTLSELAANGGTCRVAHHPDGIVIVDQGAELIPVSDEAWADIQSRWTVGAQ